MKNYTYLLFVFNSEIEEDLYHRRMSFTDPVPPTMYTGFGSTGVVLPRLNQAYPLTINREIFEPGLGYLNFLIEPLGIHLNRGEIRDLTKLDYLQINPRIEKFDKYGRFCFKQYPSTYIQVNSKYV